VAAVRPVVHDRLWVDDAAIAQHERGLLAEVGVLIDCRDAGERVPDAAELAEQAVQPDVPAAKTSSRMKPATSGATLP